MHPLETDSALPVTGIGSVPFATAHEAVEFVLATTPRAPYVPELLAAGNAELMLLQPFPAESAAGFELQDDGSLDLPKQCVERHFFGAVGAPRARPSAATLIARLGERSKVSFLKSQCVGPVTAAKYLSLNGRPVEDSVKATAALSELLLGFTRQEVDSLKHVGVPIVWFFDEPGLHLLEELPSDGLSGFLDSLKNLDVITGVHCCGVLSAKVMQALRPEIWSVSVSGSLVSDSAERELFEHIDRGGRVALGGTRGEIEASGLLRKFPADRVILTPSCGLGMRAPAEAESIFTGLKELANAELDRPASL